MGVQKVRYTKMGWPRDGDISKMYSNTLHFWTQFYLNIVRLIILGDLIVIFYVKCWESTPIRPRPNFAKPLTKMHVLIWIYKNETTDSLFKPSKAEIYRKEFVFEIVV